MAHQQLVADVHPNEPCPLNKLYDLMDANKKIKIDLEHVQCPPESKILMNIIKNHSLRFSIAASSSIPCIYMAQFWHTLKEDGSKYRLKFMLDKKELSLTLDDFRTIFYLPQATDNNHDSFVPPLSFYDMIPFYKNHLGFTMELKTPSSFKTTGLLQLAAIGRNLLFSSSFNIFDCVSKIHEDHHWEIQKQSWNEDSRLDDFRRDEASEALLNVCGEIHTCSPTPLLIVNKAYELILHDTLQVSLAKHKSRQEQEARENMAPVEKHLASEEIEKMVEGQEHVVDDSSIPRNDEHNILDTRLEPRSDKESPEHLHEAMADSLPTMVDKHIKEQVEKQVPEQVRNQVPVYVSEGLILERQKTKEEMKKMIAKAILQERGNIQGEKSAKWQKISEYETYVSRESSSGHDNEQEQGPSTSGNQEQADDYDFWTDSYASDDDEIPAKQVLQDIMEERDPEAPTLSLINQDLLYLKKENSGPEKIVLSLHKFPTVFFNDDDIEERTSRWVNKCVKKFNPYARYGVEYWKNPLAKIFYIRKPKEPGILKEVIYSNLKIV
nr:hypothetical protein [Tanacetum cinerariifolium]